MEFESWSWEPCQGSFFLGAGEAFADEADDVVAVEVVFGDGGEVDGAGGGCFVG